MSVTLKVWPFYSGSNIRYQFSCSKKKINFNIPFKKGDSLFLLFSSSTIKVENSSSSHKEVQQLPYEIDVGSHAGVVEKTFSPCLVGFENAGIKSQPTNIVDLNFAERRKPWSYVSNRWEDGSRDVRTKSGICEDEIALNIFEEPRTVKDFHVCVLDQ